MPAKVHDHFIRRIFLPHELEQIKEQQRDAREFKQHYPRHMLWLEHAHKEVSSGKRILFGIFRSAIDGRGQAFTEIVGSLMLKPESTEYEDKNINSIEIKNLYLLTAYRNMGWGSALYNEAERFCAQNGYSQIVTEVPRLESDTVNFLHRKGFKVNRVDPSRFGNKEDIYVMVKTLFPSFTGDYFDIHGIAYWMAKNYFCFSHLKWINNQQWLEFRFEDQAALARVDEATQEKLSIRGIIMISDEDTPVTAQAVASALKSKNYHLALVIGKPINKPLEDYSKDKEVKLIDIKFIYENLAGWFTHKQVHFEKEDIAGMIVPMNPQFFAKLANAMPVQSEFTYFKVGDIGKYLKPGNTVFINVEPSEEYPEEGIKGYGVVDSLMYGHRDEVWKAYKDKNPIFNEDSFKQYVGERQYTLAIHLRQFTRIQNLNDEDLAEFMLPSITRTPRYFYLSFAMRENLHQCIKVVKVESPAQTPQNTLYSFISYSRKDEGHATKLENDLFAAERKTWRDTSQIYPGAAWPSELEDAIRNCSHMLVIATKNALESKYVLDEIVYARQRGKTIIPLLYEKMELPLLLSSTQAIDMYSDYAAGLRLLLEHLRTH